jgi:Subtilase family/Fibronectin type III domain/Putative binding domain, N-terminal
VQVLGGVVGERFDYGTTSSVTNPAESSNPGVLAVGAADWTTPNVIESFSSQGPTPDGRIKPDIVGADRADTISYGARGFPGTSQAAPHVAGLAALVKSAFPSYTPKDVANYLKANAVPRGPTPDDTWGYGFAYLRDLCQFSVGPSSATAGEVGGVLSFTVTAAVGCNWTATSNVPWLVIQAGASGSANGVVSVNVAANTAGARTATITIAGITVTVNQAAAAAVLPLSEPRNLSATVVGNAITLTWLRPLTGVPTGYTLEAGSASGLANLATLVLGNTVSFSTGAPNGTYFIRVRARSAVGQGPPSNEFLVVVGPKSPGAPNDLRATVVGSTVSLQWSAPTTGGTATGYVLQAGSAPGLSNVLVVPLGGATSITATGVPSGTYFVRVVATNAVGAGPPSAEATVIVGGSNR